MLRRRGAWKLTATSKRGRANLDLEATTGSASYLIVSGLDDWQTSTQVYDIMKPFTLTGGGFTMQVCRVVFLEPIATLDHSPLTAPAHTPFRFRMVSESPGQ